MRNSSIEVHARNLRPAGAIRRDLDLFFRTGDLLDEPEAAERLVRDVQALTAELAKYQPASLGGMR